MNFPLRCGGFAENSILMGISSHAGAFSSAMNICSILAIACRCDKRLKLLEDSNQLCNIFGTRRAKRSCRTYLLGGHATSLEVERKHVQDKAGGLPVTISLATASRNSVIKRYRVHGQRAVKKIRQQEKERHGDRFANVRAVALQRRPDLMPRARGWRFW